MILDSSISVNVEAKKYCGEGLIYFKSFKGTSKYVGILRVLSLLLSGQSYKQFMIVIYESRVVIWAIF